MTDLAAFKASLARSAAPPVGSAAPLAALWWTGKGDWDRAHGLVQDDATPDAAWVHAHLHRVEGDPVNARYWYGRAGRPASDAPLDTEWDAIAAALLGPDGG